MATTTKLVGDVIEIELAEAGQTIAKLVENISLSISTTADNLEIINKDNAGWKDYALGQKTFTIDFTAHAVWSTNLDDLNDLVINNKTIDFVIKTNDATDKQYSGQAVVTSIDGTFNTNEVIELSATLQGKGALVFAVPTP